MPSETMPSPPSQTRKEDAELPALVKKGTAALESGDLDAALESFQSVIRHFPDRPEGHNNLGALYASLGRHAEAEACFDRVLELLPDNPNVHYNRGLMRAKQEKLAAAVLDFEVTMAHNPADPDVHNNLGVTAFMAGDAARARTHFQAALDSRPDHVGALLNLCDLDEAAGDTAAALQRCRDHLALHNDFTVRRKVMGLLLNRGLKDLAGAAEEARALLAVNPEDQEARQELERLERGLPLLLGQ